MLLFMRTSRLSVHCWRRAKFFLLPFGFSVFKNTSFAKSSPDWVLAVLKWQHGEHALVQEDIFYIEKVLYSTMDYY